TPGLWVWSVNLPLLLVFAVAIVYWTGSRRTPTPPRMRRRQRVKDFYFYAALVVIAIALNSPLDLLSEQVFWAHMVQHVLLLVVAPPLLVLARPWTRLWRLLPLEMRRSLGRSLVQGERTAPLRWASRTLGRPVPSFVLFSAVLLAWHVPALFDATLRSTALHALEHTLFFGTAVIFWKQVIDSPPLHADLGAPQRVAYVVGAMVVSWALAVVLALA